MRGGSLQLYLSSSKVVMTSFCTSWWRAQVGVNDLVFFLVDVRVKPTRVMILRRESRIIESL